MPEFNIYRTGAPRSSRDIMKWNRTLRRRNRRKNRNKR